MPQRGSKALWITCGLEERDEPDTLLLMVAGRYPQDASGAHVRDDRRRRAPGAVLPSEARPRPEGIGAFSTKAVQAKFLPRACKPKSIFRPGCAAR